MSSSAQTGESRESHAPPPPPSRPHPSVYSSTNYAASQPLSNTHPDINVELAPVLQEENAFLSFPTAPKPPPISPPNFCTSHLPHAFPPRPEPAQTNGPSRKRHHHLWYNSSHSTSNCSNVAAERLYPKKRGAVRNAPKAHSHPADFQAKPADGDEEFRELIDFSDAVDMGEDDDGLSQEQQFADPKRFGDGEDTRMMPPPGRPERLHGAFMGEIETGYFNEDIWKHDDDGVLGSAPMPQFSNILDEDEGQGLTTWNIPGMLEAGISMSSQCEFENASFGVRERYLSSVPNAAIGGVSYDGYQRDLPDVPSTHYAPRSTAHYQDEAGDEVVNPTNLAAISVYPAADRTRTFQETIMSGERSVYEVMDEMKSECLGEFQEGVASDDIRPREPDPFMLTMGVAESRELDYDFYEPRAVREEVARFERPIPTGLAAIARWGNRLEDEEGTTVGATQYQVSAVHAATMTLALTGQQPPFPKYPAMNSHPRGHISALPLPRPRARSVDSLFIVPSQHQVSHALPSQSLYPLSGGSKTRPR